MGCSECSSALTKMTAILYQREIEAAKHGRNLTEVTAVETRLRTTDNCFGFVNDGPCPTVRMMNIADAVKMTHPCTKLSYTAAASSPTNLLERAIVGGCMAEELDDISRTNDERLAVAVFVAFISRRRPRS
ncbi:hypothetical protein GGR56DRAFT_654204 [Xylariaceae sp. FL0804]|nr:hypothetical protein GGR56DRAFT_654204 [Xylariaceae sp. FL0804]